MSKDLLVAIRSLIGALALIFSFYTYHLMVTSLILRASGPAARWDSAAAYASFFIPLNLLGWLTLGRFGGITMLAITMFSIMSLALRQGVFTCNIYLFLSCVAAFAGYKIYARAGAAKSRVIARFETLDADKNTLMANAARRDKDIVTAQGRLQRYMELKDMTENLSVTLELDEVARLVTEEMYHIIGRSDRALLYLVDNTRQELNLVSSYQAASPEPVKAKKGEIFDQWILKQRRPLIIDDLDNEFRFSPEALRSPEDWIYKSIIGLPVVNDKKIVGVVRMSSKMKNAYDQDDLRLLSIIADLAAVGIGNVMLYQRTKELAITDGLTGLYVQRYFKERLEAEVRRALSSAKKFSLLMIDLDHFKACNDTYGHTAGDIILVKVAQLLRETIGGGHIDCRYGGEEFSAFLFETDLTEAVKLAQEVRRVVEELARRGLSQFL
ncbi:MAG: sensor domain-containing diguanylate cyclase [Candidatus Omnitrophota bacterium]